MAERRQRDRNTSRDFKGRDKKSSFKAPEKKQPDKPQNVSEEVSGEMIGKIQYLRHCVRVVK